MVEEAEDVAGEGIGERDESVGGSELSAILGSSVDASLFNIPLVTSKLPSRLRHPFNPDGTGLTLTVHISDPLEEYPASCPSSPSSSSSSSSGSPRPLLRGAMASAPATFLLHLRLQTPVPPFSLRFRRVLCWVRVRGRFEWSGVLLNRGCVMT